MCVGGTKTEPSEKIDRVLAVLGTCAALALWAAPVRDVLVGPTSVLGLRSSAKLATGFHLFAATFNCLLWTWHYVMIRNLSPPLVLNAVGLALNAATAMCYWTYSSPRQRQEANWQIAGMLGLACGLQVVADADLGSLACLFNILMYFGPLMAARKVCESRSNSSMPLPTLCLTLVCSTIWLSYASVKHDGPMLVANAFGVVFGMVQLAVWGMFRRREADASVVTSSSNIV